MKIKTLLAVVTLLLASLAFGQDTGTGTPAFNAFSHAGGGIDTINLGNLNVHMDVPLRSLGAYGPRASATLEADSVSTVDPVYLQLTTPFGLGVNFSPFHAVVTQHRRTGTSCADYEIVAVGVRDG